MPRKRIYKFKRALQGYMNKIRGNNKLSKELYDQMNVNTSNNFNYYRLTKARSAFKDNYAL